MGISGGIYPHGQRTDEEDMTYHLELTCNRFLEYFVTIWLPGDSIVIPVAGPDEGLELIKNMKLFNWNCRD